jgi:hypothetical protein
MPDVPVSFAVRVSPSELRAMDKRDAQLDWIENVLGVAL